MAKRRKSSDEDEGQQKRHRNEPFRGIIGPEQIAEITKHVRSATIPGIAPDLVQAVIKRMPAISAGDLLGPTEIGRISAAQIAGTINTGDVGVRINAQPQPGGITIKQIVAGINDGDLSPRVNPGSLPTVITPEQLASVAAPAGPPAASDLAQNIDVGRTGAAVIAASNPIDLGEIVGHAGLNSGLTGMAAISSERLLRGFRVDTQEAFKLKVQGAFEGFPITRDVLAESLRPSQIDWGAANRRALGPVDLIAPTRAQGPPALLAFPPDLVEHDPLDSGIEVDALVVDGQLGAQLFLTASSPKAADRMRRARTRILEGDAEALSQSLASCRRALHALADSVYPPRSGKVVDSAGKQRAVDANAFKNRLLMFLTEAIESTGTLALAEAEINHLVARLDALVSKLDKGVHAEVVRAEALHAYVETWALMAHVARFAADEEIDG